MLNQHTLRTPETQKRYMEYFKNEYDGHCIYCAKELLIKEYEHWVIIDNKFPYDKIYGKHHQLAPKRHVEFEYELTEEERAEKHVIINKYEVGNYEAMRENFPDGKSLPEHLHYHLLDDLLV